MVTFVISIGVFGRNVNLDVAHELAGPLVDVQQFDQVEKVVVEHDAHQVESAESRRGLGGHFTQQSAAESDPDHQELSDGRAQRKASALGVLQDAAIHDRLHPLGVGLQRSLFL